MNKNILLIFSILLTINVFGQIINNKNSWQIGVGLAITKFGESDAQFIGDKHLIQIPRVNLTMPISQKLSFDGALSFNTIDGVIKNSINYLSLDGSLRYNFNSFLGKIYPYVFTGGSLVDSERKTTPTLNVGAGATYWISDKVGLNTQLYYKYSFESFESMRSHIQITAGFVFDLNWSNVFGRGIGTTRVRTSSCHYDQHKI
ncbi:Probable hypothetical protein precursor [Tenacibaculum maritimum]|uniref:hypothetical protein n=1 Tax=Tenacibaculum maritimum TaxID=107401 RepID=UPI0012E4D9BA|nr:hypothetical protein [Tenacibaculum maritimum]CAA0191320.1 Probable hypothetical protein precursor [Tenacibaculum maritimum]